MGNDESKQIPDFWLIRGSYFTKTKARLDMVDALAKIFWAFSTNVVMHHDI